MSADPVLDDELEEKLRQVVLLATPALQGGHLRRARLVIDEIYDGYPSESISERIGGGGYSDPTARAALARVEYAEDRVIFSRALDRTIRELRAAALIAGSTVDGCMSHQRRGVQQPIFRSNLCTWCYMHRDGATMPALADLDEHLAGRRVKRK